MALKSGTVTVAAAKSLVHGDPVPLLEGGIPAASTPVDTLGNSHTRWSSHLILRIRIWSYNKYRLTTGTALLLAIGLPDCTNVLSLMSAMRPVLRSP